jgi:magnesium-transporting ATPase (P-type)
MIDPDNNDKMKIYVKGAPEYLLKMCNYFQSEDGRESLD